MNWNEVSMWVLLLMVLTLTAVVYIRVDLHDWGMVGFTVFLFGVSVLVTRWVMGVHGWAHPRDEMVIAWRGLVIAGTPFAVAGYVAGFWRDPPPRRQVVRRMSILVAVVVAALVMVAVW